MSNNSSKNETLVDQTVTYHVEIDRRFLLIEDVPARVNVETGERYFAPETVERLQQAVWGQCRPVRTIQTPVAVFEALPCGKSWSLRPCLEVTGHFAAVFQDSVREKCHDQHATGAFER